LNSLDRGRFVIEGERQLVALARMPIVAGIGGNSGNQTINAFGRWRWIK
jgi:Mg/Co/Ni transporter MgtE